MKDLELCKMKSSKNDLVFICSILIFFKATVLPVSIFWVEKNETNKSQELSGFFFFQRLIFVFLKKIWENNCLNSWQRPLECQLP